MKDYRCGDCEWWDKRSYYCNKKKRNCGPDLCKKCKHFKLKK